MNSVHNTGYFFITVKLFCIRCDADPESALASMRSGSRCGSRVPVPIVSAIFASWVRVQVSQDADSDPHHWRTGQF